MIIFNELVLQILIRIMKDIRNRFDQLKDLSVWNIELIVCWLPSIFFKLLKEIILYLASVPKRYKLFVPKQYYIFV